jgi:drug/metabolite transporter (DMT)-like permease
MDPRAIAMGVAFALMWSSAFTSARMIVTEAPPLTALALRFLISGALGVGIAALMGESWRLTRAQWTGVAVFGVMQNAAYLGLNFVAMQTIPASVAAIVASAMPLLVAAALWAGWGERLAPLGIAGLAAGFAGVAVIMGARVSGGVEPLGLVFCLLGVLALSAATLAVRGASGTGTGAAGLLMVVGLQMLVGSAVLWPLAFLFERGAAPPPGDWSLRLIFAFAYTTLVPGLATTWVWFALVRRIGATRAATFHFLNPFFGVAIAGVLLAEPLGPGDILGVAIVAAGILAVQRARPTRT